MNYIRICPVCGSQDLELPRRIESMPGFSVNEKYYCNNCGKESVPILVDADAYQEKDITDEFQIIELIPIDTINYKDQAMISEITWHHELQPAHSVETFASYKNRLAEKKIRPDVWILDLNGICNAQTNYRILKELAKSKYHTYLDPGVHDISDIFDAFTLDVWKVICSSICTNSMDVFEEAFEISDHVIPCIYIHEGKAVWKSHKGEREVSRAIKQLEKIGFEEISIIDIDCIGKSADQKYIDYIAELHPNVIYGGGVNRNMLPALKDSGLSGAIIDTQTIKTD